MKFKNGETVLKTLDELETIIKDADNVIAITMLCGVNGLNPMNSQFSLAAAESNLINKLIPFVHSHNGRFIILSCALPYDVAKYTEADAVLLAWSPKGMSEKPIYHSNKSIIQYGPAIPAAIYMLFSSDDSPTGKLPLSIPVISSDFNFTNVTLYERGYGLKYSD